MTGTFLDGEHLEKGGKRKLEVGSSVVTIGRCTMTLQLMRQKLVEPERRRGEATDCWKMVPFTKSCIRFWYTWPRRISWCSGTWQ